MRSVIHTTTLIIASLTATALTAAAAATVNDATFTTDVSKGFTLCDPFAITGKVTGEADSDVYYGGLAYSTDVGGPYNVLTTGEMLKKDDSGAITYRESMWRTKDEFTNITLPDSDMYTFGILTVNIPLGVDTTLKDNTITGFSQSNKLDGGKVFLTVKDFPPSASNVVTNQMLKATATCREVSAVVTTAR